MRAPRSPAPLSARAPRRWRLAALAVAWLAGCGGAPARPAPATRAAPAAAPAANPEDDAARLADDLLAMLTEMARIVAAHRAPDGCAAMAADLDALFVAAAPRFERARHVRDDPAAAQRLVAALDRHAGAAEALRQQVTAGLLPCRGTPALAEAIGRMPVL